MDWAAFGAFWDKYGLASIIVITLGWFFIAKIWPLVEKLIVIFEKLINGILENARQQTQILEKIIQWQDEQDKRTGKHVADTERIAEMIRNRK